MPQRLNYVELAPEAMAAMRSVEHYLNVASGLESNLLELVRLRASLRNGCDFCIGLHTHEMQKHNETPGRIAEVAAWRNSGAYTERERAALAWTEAVTDIQVEHASDEAFAAVQEHFQGKELVDLTVAIASINAWNRMAIGFRAEKRRTTPNTRPVDGPAPQAATEKSNHTPASEQVGDGGKVSADE